MVDVPVPEVNGEDDAALDAELNASLDAVRSGKTIGVRTPSGEVVPTGQTGEAAPTGPTGEDSPTGEAEPTGATGETGSTDEAPGAPQGTGATGESEFRIPLKGKFESDEAFEKRVELFDLVKRRRAATTQEAKDLISTEIRRTKGELKAVGTAERFTTPKTEIAPTGATGATGEADPDQAADLERLRALGGATKEDVAAIIAQERLEGQVRSDLQSFVSKHATFKDEDVREVFLDFVDANYNWQGKSGKELTTLLEMAYENMFRPSESVQDRVLKAAGVERKVGAMAFPGGTGGKTSYSPEMQASIDELKATGMSEEKAVELLSE